MQLSTKFDFGWVSAPDPLAGFKGPYTSKGRGGAGRGGKGRGGGGKGREGVGDGRGKRGGKGPLVLGNTPLKLNPR